MIKGFKLEATRGAFEVLLRNTLMLLRRLEVLGTTCKTLHIASKGTRKTRIVAPLLGLTQLLKSLGGRFPVWIFNRRKVDAHLIQNV